MKWGGETKEQIRKQVKGLAMFIDGKDNRSFTWLSNMKFKAEVLSRQNLYKLRSDLMDELKKIERT